MSISRLKTLINIAKNEFKLDPDTYRQMLVNLTGKDSLKAMKQSELQTVLDAFKDKGFKVKSKPGAPRVSTNAKGKPKTQEISRIRAVWRNMFDQGFIADGSESALNVYVQRMTAKLNGGLGVREVGWLDAKRATRLLESLKKWHLRLIKQALTDRRVRFPENKNGEPFNYYDPFAELYNRLNRYDKYIAELEASGQPLKIYGCPRCGFKLKTTAPINSRDMWDSICTCPACNGVYKKWVTAGNVVTRYVYP